MIESYYDVEQIHKHINKMAALNDPIPVYEIDPHQIINKNIHLSVWILRDINLSISPLHTIRFMLRNMDGFSDSQLPTFGLSESSIARMSSIERKMKKSQDIRDHILRIRSADVSYPCIANVSFKPMIIVDGYHRLSHIVYHSIKQNIQVPYIHIHAFTASELSVFCIGKTEYIIKKGGQMSLVQNDTICHRSV